jgi:hypothetical protein
VGASGEIAAIGLGFPSSIHGVNVFYYITQESTYQLSGIYTLFITPGYTMHMKIGGTWYSGIGRVTAYQEGEANGVIDRLKGQITGFGNLNLTYYFTKN